MADLATRPTIYRHDFYAWAVDQADLLRAMLRDRVNTPLDLENLIDEVEGLATSALNGARSQTRRILEHLLELEYSPAAAPRAGWRESVAEARAELDQQFTPTLRRVVAAEFEAIYQKARRVAAHGLEKHGEVEAAQQLPQACPYSFDQVENPDWYPEARAEHKLQ